MTSHRQKLLRWSLLGLASFAALLLAAPLVLNQERYRDLLADRASRLLDRDVRVDSLRVRLLPRPGATVRGLTVADRTPRSGPFIEADRLHVSLKLLPLLRGELHVKEIRIDRPRIRLTHGPDGWNLEDLIRPAARAVSSEQRRGEGAKSGRAEPLLPALLAGALTVRDGTILLDQPGQHRRSAPLEIRGLNVEAVAPPSGPIRIHASGQLPGEGPGSFELVVNTRPEAGDRLPIDAHLTVRGAGVPQLASLFGLSGSTASAFSGGFDLELKAVGDWPTLNLQADADLRRLGLSLGEAPGKAPGDEGRLLAKGRWDGDTLDIPDVNLRWKGQTITARFHVAHLQAPRIHYEVNVPELALDSLVAMSSAFGSGEATSDTPRRSREHGGRSAAADRRTRAGQPDGLQLEGRIRSGAARWGGLVLTSADGETSYADGMVAIRRLRGSFYGGSLSGHAALDWRGRQPRTMISARLEGVQTEPLLRALQEERWKLRGVMTLDSQLELAGRFGPDALTRVSGKSELVVTDGHLIGYPPLDRVSQTFSPLLKSAGIASGLNEFDRLSAHWTLDKGLLRTDDLLLQREGARISAAGSMNVQDQRLNFDVTAKAVRATLEAKVSGTPSEPVVTPNVGRIERRVKTEVGKFLKSGKGEALGKALREFLPR